MLSVVYVSYRPGGIDLLGRSLAAQQNPPPWELIVVDDYPGRPERGIAERHLRQLGLPLSYYGPSKPKTRPETKLGLANAMNTGALHARGDDVLILHDYTIYPPDALATWRRKLDTGPRQKLISGWARRYSCPQPDPTQVDDICSGLDGVPLKWEENWVPEEFEGFYFGGSRLFWEQINGLDERSDHCTVWVLHLMIRQAKFFGWQLVVDKDLPCLMIDHRAWDKSDVHEDKNDSLWRIKYHASTDVMPEWTPRSANAFNFAALRRMVLGT